VQRYAYPDIFAKKKDALVAHAYTLLSFADTDVRAVFGCGEDRKSRTVGFAATLRLAAFQ